MNLLFRFIRSLILSIYRILVAVTTVIFRHIVVVLLAIFRFVIWPFFVAVIGLLWGLIILSFRATVNGPRRFTDRLAGEWAERMVELVEDRNRVNEIFQLCRFMVGATIVLGWVIVGLFTASILWVVFGYFI